MTKRDEGLHLCVTRRRAISLLGHEYHAGPPSEMNGPCNEVDVCYHEFQHTLSALPVTKRCSVAGLKATDKISASWAWILSLGSSGDLVSQLNLNRSINQKRRGQWTDLHHQHLVVSNACKDIFVSGMPIYVLNPISTGLKNMGWTYSDNRCMTFVCGCGFNCRFCFSVRVDVPVIQD